jgi:hypothetical protein
MIPVNFKSNKFRATKILVSIIVIIYISFLYMDISNIGVHISNVLKFISIILAFIISILGKKNSLSYKDIHLLQIGLFITIFADLFLLILDSHYILGMILFSIVQIIYSFRYDFRNVKPIIRNFIIIFLGLSLFYLILNRFINIDFILIVGVFYAICLLISVGNAIKAYKYKLFPKPNRQMILIGMILFLLCDINVALYNITREFVNISSVSMWLFYLPSQVLLALSCYNYNGN